MIVNLSDCDISYEMDQDPYIILDDTRERIILLLTEETWVIFLSVKIPEANNSILTHSHFQSEVLTPIKLYSDKEIRVPPLASLSCPCFIIYDRNYDWLLSDV